MLTYQSQEDRSRPFKVLRPNSTPPGVAGKLRMGGWIGPDGKFYHARHWHHDRVAGILRETGDGPAARWDINDPRGWFKVMSSGEVIARPDLVVQIQLDTLADMLMASSEGTFRSHLVTFLRLVQRLPTHV
jgi:hypothetical protein